MSGEREGPESRPHRPKRCIDATISLLREIPVTELSTRNNEFDNFRLVFDRMFMGTVVGRMDDNEAIFKRVLDDPEFQKTLMDLYAMRVYRRLREPENGAMR